MRTKVAKALRKSFKEALKRRLPDFTQVQDFKDSAGGLLFSQKMAENLICFIMLELASNKDCFALSVAWTPADGQIRMSSPEPKPSQERWYGRLEGPKQAQRSTWNGWWVLNPAETGVAMANPPSEEEEIEKIPSMVDDAMARIELQAIPLFERVRKSRKRRK